MGGERPSKLSDLLDYLVRIGGSLWATGMILVVSVLGIAGVMGDGLVLTIQAGLVGYVLGDWRAVCRQSEYSRTRVEASLKDSIAEGHRLLETEVDLDEDMRARIEQDLSQLTSMLSTIDRAAPWYVKRRRRREQRHA
jgi:uncharacterized protein YhaN